MRKPAVAVLTCAALVLIAATAGAADGPRAIGGFVLGEDITRYKDSADLMSALPIRYAEYLREVLIKDVPGFKTGQIYYGMCENPGKILRIRLKYADGSKEFFEKLLEKMTERFGKATEWRGDPFGVVIAWKWSLKTSEGQQVSMILQYNSLDEEESKGNTIKLALTDEMKKERDCYLKKHPEEAVSLPGEGTGGAAPGSVNWKSLVPSP